MVGQFPLIPNEAFLYFPSQRETLSQRNNKFQRNIFDGNIQYSNEEQEQLRLFQDYLAKQKGVSANIKNCYRPVLLRHLQATQFNHQKCLEALQKLFKWEEGMLPLRITPTIQRILKSGVLYHCGRDSHFRPIFVINVGSILKMKLKEKQVLNVLGYFFQYAIQHLLIEGQVENWNSIIDLGSASVFSLGGTLVDTITFLSSMFRCRVNHSFLVNCPSSIKWVWGMVKSSLNEDQLSKISMTEKSVIGSHAWEYINPTQVQKKYGGNMDDITEYWPISVTNHASIAMPKGKLHTVDHGKMISIDQYNKLFQKQELVNKKIKQALIRKFCQQFHETTKNNFFKLSISKASKSNGFFSPLKSINPSQKASISIFRKSNKENFQEVFKTTQSHLHQGSVICECVDIPEQEYLPEILDEIFLLPLTFEHW